MKQDILETFEIFKNLNVKDILQLMILGIAIFVFPTIILILL